MIQKYSCLLFKRNHNKYMTILLWCGGFEVIVFSIGEIYSCEPERVKNFCIVQLLCALR